MKLALSAALALAIIALALFLWRAPPRSAPIEPAPLGQTTVPAPVEPQEPRVEASQAPAVSPLAEEPQRSVVAPPEVAVEAAPHPATVRVRLVSRDDGTPVAGERLALYDPRDQSWGVTHVESSRAAPGQSPVTDSEGRAEFDVPAGVPWGLQVISRDWEEASDIPPLAEGEQREVTVELPTRVDVTLHGRLVDAESGQPLAGGVIRVEPSRGLENAPAQEILASADGTFVIEARSWEVQFASASGEEHARAIFDLEAGHESPERALEVRLSRAAALEVLVLEGSSPVADAKVELGTHLYHLRLDTDFWSFPMGEDPTWTARSDLSGLAVVESLPPRAPLELTIDPRDRPRRVEAEPVVLDPGERRRVEIRLGSGGTIAGRVEDSKGQAVPDLAIWRIAAEFPAPKRIESYETPAARTRTDAQGRFRFEDVPAGSWHVGPPSVSSWDESALTADAVAALAQPVGVEEGSVSSDIVIRIDRGLYLSGIVLDPDGQPAPEVSVSAHSQTAWEYLNEQTDDAGRFRIGPLTAGSYALQASGFGRGSHAPSESAIAEAGASELTLQLRVGASIRGRTLDAAGRLRECKLMLVREGEDSWTVTKSEGEFSFDGLLPGTYALNAQGSGGVCGRRAGLYLRAGTTLKGIDVVLERGALLRLTFDEEQPHAAYAVFVDGTAFESDGLERGKEGTITVPAGEIEVRWWNPKGELQTVRRLTLAQGEERAISWDGKD
jgi:protocatechuate 3,4-dioxygenase beta subunit